MVVSLLGDSRDPSSTVIVTGAASGMGAAVVDDMLTRNWHVIGIDIQPFTQRADVAEHCEDGSSGPRFETVQADICQEADVAVKVAKVLDRTPPLRALVNAAGIYPTSSLGTYSTELYRKIFDINVLGTLNMSRIAVGHFGPRPAAIVNFASIDAFAVSGDQLVYSASKAAIVSITKSLSAELGPATTVNAIAPGWVDTPGTRAGGRLNDGVSRIPLGRAADCSEIAEWVHRLIDSNFMTGETVIVSGGVIAR